ncbi:MAG TPA: glutathione S-transferase family protein, partial [Polyangiaceae bacterium]
VLIALYENETTFEPRFVDLADPGARAELEQLWPFVRFPVLRDRARNQVVPESSVIIEYLAQHHPGPVALLPADPERALETRFQDRFYDVYLHEPMQKIVGDRLRPAGEHDPHGVARAKQLIETAYGVVERQMATRTWAAGDAFSLADCAAAPALHYANRVHPLGETHRNAAAFLARLEARPSFKRVLAEAEPYFDLFPG